MSIDRVGNRYRARLETPGGRRLLGTFDTREEAEDVLRAARQLVAGRYPLGITVGRYLDGWLTGRTCKSRDDEAGIAKRYVDDDPIAEIALSALRPAHVRDWTKRLLRRELATGTVRTALGLLRRALNDALGTQVKTNACDGVKLPKERRTEEAWTYLTPGEQEALVGAAPSPEVADLLAFCIGTGMRAGEVAAIRRVDVDVEAGSAVVRFGGPPDEPTKSGKVRTIALFGMALDAARRQLERPSVANGALWPRDRGGFRDPRHLVSWATWKQLLEAAGIRRRLRWHDLRHTCATSLVCGWWGRRWSIQEVSAQLGHSSINLTTRYAHLANETLLSAGRQTQNLLPPPVEKPSVSTAHALPRGRARSPRKRSVRSKAPLAGLEPATTDLEDSWHLDECAVNAATCAAHGQALGKLAETATEVLRFIAAHGVAPTAKVVEICEQVVRLARVDKIAPTMERPSAHGKAQG